MRSERARLSLRVLAGIAVLAAVVLSAIPAAAQTPDQLRIFQSMPKEQRDAILEQLGMGRGGRGAGGRGGGDQIVVETAPGAGSGDMPTEDDLYAITGDRRISGGETLLIQLTLPEDIDQAAVAAAAAAAQRTGDARSMPSTLAQPPLIVKPPKRTPEERAELDALRERILDRNPYELDLEGTLRLPGFAPIRLAGLKSLEVQERLALDPKLREFQVGVTVLRIRPAGARALKPFGYDMLKAGANAFVPGTDIPAPPNYVLGPGDVLDVQLYGQTRDELSLPVSREGTVSLPDLGPVAVGGLGFGAARNLIESRVREQMIGTQARVTLSELASVRVLVLGDAERPGSYVVSGLSTVTNALFAGGGVKRIGSLRNIEVKRGGKLVGKLDLYDVLLDGDTADDMRLRSGDAVFVPPIGRTAGIDGEVRRPAIYELVDERTAGELVDLAGGLTTEADGRLVTVERIGENRQRRIVTIDLTTEAGRSFALEPGDTLRVAMVRPVVDNGIALEGHVVRPGMFEYRPGVRLTDVIRSADDVAPRGDLNYVLIRRESTRDQSVSAFSADLAAALAAPGSAADVALEPRDRITVFDLETDRERVVEPLLLELRRQGRPDGPSRVVSIGGRVNVPGTYPLEDGMRASDLLRAGGGLQDAAFPEKAELARYEVAGGEVRRQVSIVDVDLGAVLRGDPAADVELRPYDVLTIKQTPEWTRVEEIELVGEVRFPGRYQIRRGEKLGSVLERAGGLTPLAFARGAIFTREDLRQKEREQLERLAQQLQGEIAALTLQASQTNPAAIQSLTAGQGILDQIRSATPVGRLVIDLEGAGPDGSDREDVILRNGDKLYVPRVTQEVSVLGEVQSPTSHLISPGMTRDDAIALAGGATQKADRDRAYVVRADGSVVGSGSGWFSRSGNVELQPGDTVVVPLDAARMRPLAMWTAITTIIYNLAVTVAAISSI